MVREPTNGKGGNEDGRKVLKREVIQRITWKISQAPVRRSAEDLLGYFIPYYYSSVARFTRGVIGFRRSM